MFIKAKEAQNYLYCPWMSRLDLAFPPAYTKKGTNNVRPMLAGTSSAADSDPTGSQISQGQVVECPYTPHMWHTHAQGDFNNNKT